jgi:hypothetical protein
MKCMPRKLNLSKSQQETLNREIRDEMLKMNEKYEKDFDTVLVYILNKHLGLGKKRIKRLYHLMISDRIELRRFYADDNNSDSKIDIFAMQKELERKGIDLPQIFKEIMQERFDEVNELNAHNKRKG